MQQDFQKRYGYDPLVFLPVMTGRIVGSPAQSDRFLWDLRRLVADRISTEYVGGLRDLCNANGLKMWLENTCGRGLLILMTHLFNKNPQKFNDFGAHLQNHDVHQTRIPKIRAPAILAKFPQTDTE